MTYAQSQHRGISRIEDLRLEDLVPGIMSVSTQLSSQFPTGFIDVANIEGITVIRMHVSGSLRICYDVSNNFMSLFIIRKKIGRALIFGNEINAGDVVIIPPDCRYDAIQSGSLDSIIVTLPNSLTGA